MEPSDDELMAQVARGDRQAFARLIDRHRDALVRYLTQLTGCWDRAEDLAQDTFLRLFQAAGGYRPRGRFTGYLYRIAVNLVRSQERRHRRWKLLVPLMAGTNGDGPEYGAPREVLVGELRQQVQEAVVELPLSFRVPLLLYEIEEWSYADIAAALGCREGTVKSRIHRGRRKLEATLGPYLEGGAP